MKDHKASLEKQMYNKGGAPVMADHEFQLNKKLLDVIEAKNQGSPVSTTIKKPF